MSCSTCFGSRESLFAFHFPPPRERGGRLVERCSFLFAHRQGFFSTDFTLQNDYKSMGEVYYLNRRERERSPSILPKPIKSATCSCILGVCLHAHASKEYIDWQAKHKDAGPLSRYRGPVSCETREV